MADSNYWTRLSSRRLARRTFVQRGAMVGAGAAGIVLVGCSSSNNNKTSNAPTQAASASSAASAVATASRPAGTAAPVGTARPSGSPGAANAGGPVQNTTYGKNSGTIQKLDQPKTPGGTWRLFSYDALPPDNLDPHQSGFGPMWGIWSMIFSKLVAFDDPSTEALSPDLATALPEQPDQLTYTFKLNPAAKWQTKTPLAPNNPLAGKQITSADVVYSFQRQMNTKSPRAGNYPNLFSLVSMVDKIEAPDATTVKFTTKLPAAPFLALVAGPTSSIISQTLVDASSDEMNAPDKLIGSGPFILDQFQALKIVRYVKNPDWHLKDSGFAKGRPFLDAIESTWIPGDDNAIEAAIKAKQVDAVQYNNYSNGARVAKENQGLQLLSVPVTGPIGGLLPVDHGPFKDARIRQAVSIAIDRNAMGNAVYQGRFRLNGLISWPDTHWALPQSDLLKKPGYRYDNQADRDADVKQAKQLLDAAGGPSAIPSGTEIIYSNTPGYIPAYFPQLQKNLQDTLGVTFQGHEDTTGYTEIIAALLQHKFDFYWSYGNGVADLDEWVYNGLHSGSPYNLTGLADKDLDAMLDKQRTDFNYESRRQTGYDIQNYMLDKVFQDIGMICLVNDFNAWNYLHNFPMSPWFQYNHLWANVWIDTGDPTFKGRPA